MLAKLVVVEIGQADHSGVRAVRYVCDKARILGHIFPTLGRAVIVAMDDWGQAKYCRNEAAAVDWLARNE